jgi:hypothetical protein
MVKIAPNLAITPEKVCFIILKAREFEAETAAAESGFDSRTIPAEQCMSNALKTQAEFSAYIETLNEKERVDLVGLTWLGCGNHTVADWPSLHAEARRTYPTQTTAYLLGTPQFADRLEEGLSRFSRQNKMVQTPHAEQQNSV